MYSRLQPTSSLQELAFHMARVLKQWTVVRNPDRRDVFGGPRQSVNYQHFLLIYQRISDHTAMPLAKQMHGE